MDFGMTAVAKGTLRIAAFFGLFICGGCSAPQSPLVETAALRLEGMPASAGLVITEVAQASPYGGTTADKVEVYRDFGDAPAQFRVCDSSESAQTCSAAIAAPEPGQRLVVSRGTSITTKDLVWLADAAGVALEGTKVSPFPCTSGQSSARLDCADATFSACSCPTLGQSSGTCAPADGREHFTSEVGFARNQFGAPEGTCTRPLCQTLLAALASAQSSIDFAIYGMRRQPEILEALVAAQNRGVRVRGVVDTEDASCSVFGYSDTQTLIAALRPGTVVCDNGAGHSYIMHNKFVVIDATKLWTGSTNISDTELGGEYSTDVAVLFTSRELSSIYEDEFEEMYSGRFHRQKTDNTEHVIEPAHFFGEATIASYFSPTDGAINNAVIPLIEQARERLDIAMFFFTHEGIAEALGAAKARGVAIRMILDASGAAHRASKHSQLCQLGIEVKVENFGGKSHSKWIVADPHRSDRAAVVFGSMNFTVAGDEQNDENTLYIKQGAFAAAFEAEFEREWQLLGAVTPCTNMPVEGALSSVCSPTQSCQMHCDSGSCCDGIDNDYDGLVDATFTGPNYTPARHIVTELGELPGGGAISIYRRWLPLSVLAFPGAVLAADTSAAFTLDFLSPAVFALATLLLRELVSGVHG